MKQVFYLYYNGEPINSLPLSEKDISEIKKHKTIHIMKGRNSKEVPVDLLHIVKRVVI